jgi:hypothetical protein
MSGGGMLGMGKSQQQASGWNQSDSSQNSVSLSNSQSASGQTVYNSDLVTQLMQKAGMAAGSATINSGDITSAAKQLFTGGNDFLSGLLTQNDAGSGYLRDSLNDTSVADQQIAQLQKDTGELFTDQFNPAITADAVSSGNLGGGRQGVAQGSAMETLAKQFSSQAVQIRTADQAQKQAAATTIAGNSLGAASTGLGSLPSLLSLVSSGNNADLDIYSKLAGIYGSPTTLSSSESTSASAAIAQAIAKSFGTNQSSGNAWNFQAAGQGGI